MKAIHSYFGRTVRFALLAGGLTFIPVSCIVTTPVRTERVVVVKKTPPGHQQHHHKHHKRHHHKHH